MEKLCFKRLDNDAIVPVRANADDAGLDLHYCGKREIVLKPGERALVSTGLAVAIPEGQVGLVCSRSGLAANHGVMVLNAPGVVDSSYRGELKVILACTGRLHYVIKPGDKVAQLLVQDVRLPQVELVDELPEAATNRGQGGFGSTGR